MNRTLCFGIYSPFSFIALEETARLTAARSKSRQFVQIAFENGICLDAVLQTSQVFLEFVGATFGKRINYPVLLPLRADHVPAAQVGEVFGNFHLRFAQDFLKMANTELRFCEQMKNAQSCAVAKALIDFDQIHLALATGGRVAAGR